MDVTALLLATHLLAEAAFTVPSLSTEPEPMQAGPAAECYRSIAETGASSSACETALTLADSDLATGRLSSALAMVHAKRGDLARAQESMDTAVARAPEDPIVQVNLGNLRIRQQRFGEAVEAYLFAQDLLAAAGEPEEPVIFLNRALALRALGRYADAKKDFDYFAFLQESRAEQAAERVSFDQAQLDPEEWDQEDVSLNPDPSATGPDNAVSDDRLDP
jgi:tetratricopeptide (TPR) repeat protein